MWESLPPVVSVVTAADDLVGVSMAGLAQGMVGTSLSDSAPPMLTNTAAGSRASTMRSCSAIAGVPTSTQHTMGLADARLDPPLPSESSASSPASKTELAHNVTSTSTASPYAPTPPPRGLLPPSWELTSTHATAGQPTSPLRPIPHTEPHTAPSAVPLPRDMREQPLLPPRGSPSSTSSPAATATDTRQCASPPPSSASHCPPAQLPLAQLEEPTNTAPVSNPFSTAVASSTDDAHPAAPHPHSSHSAASSFSCGSPASPPSSSSVMGAAAASIGWATPAAAQRRSGSASHLATLRSAGTTAAHRTSNASDATAPANGQAALYASVNPFRDLHRHSELRGATAALPAAPGTATPTPSPVPSASRPPSSVQHTPPHLPDASPYESPARQHVLPPTLGTSGHTGAPTQPVGVAPCSSTVCSTSAPPAVPATATAAALPPSPALKPSDGSDVHRASSFTTTTTTTSTRAAAATSAAHVIRVPSRQLHDSTGAAYPLSRASAPELLLPAPTPTPPPASLWNTGQPAGYSGSSPNVFTAASSSMAAQTSTSPYGALPVPHRTASPHTPPLHHQQQLQQPYRSIYGSVAGSSGCWSMGGGGGGTPQCGSQSVSHMRFQGIGNSASFSAAAATNMVGAGPAELCALLPNVRLSTPGRHACMDAADTPSLPPDGSISFAGTVDHNQSFYMGTMGNDNLRRSFFFPIGPVAGGADAAGQLEDASVHSGEVGDPEAVMPSYTQAASLWSARTSGHTAPSTALGGVGSNSSTAASATGATAATPHASVGDGKASPSTSSLAADPYCSPTLYRSLSFQGMPQQHQATPHISPPPPPPPLSASHQQHQHHQRHLASQAASASVTSQLQSAQSSLHDTSAVPGPSARDLLFRSAPGASTAPYTYVPVSSRSVSSAYESPGAIAQPLTLSMTATFGRQSGSRHASWQSGTPTPPAQLPALARASIHHQQQQQQQLGMATTSRSSSLAAVAEVSRNTGCTDASFLSPTLANSLWQRRFEEAGGAMHQERALTHPQSLMLSGSDMDTSSPHWSLPASSSQSKAAAPLPPPPPAYIVDWERSLIAFQSRAESYYTFKNVCTETYLTLIEHDVDRFLVCYYNGGVIPPEEAVQEVLARRGTYNTSAGASANTGTAASADTKGTRGTGTGTGSGIQKMLQGSKTLMKLSETGSKWLSKVGTNLRRNTVAPVPRPTSPLAAEPPQMPLGNAAMTPRSDQRPLPLTAATAPDASTQGGSLGSWVTPSTVVGVPQSCASPGMVATHDTTAAAAAAAATAAGTYTGSDATAGDAQAAFGRGTNPVADTPLEVRHASGAGLSTVPSQDSVASLAAPSSVSRSAQLPSSSTARSAWHTGDATPSTASTTASPPLLVARPTAAEVEMTCLRQLGPYVANVVPETYMDARPSEGVLAQVQRNHAILLHALHHVLTDGNSASGDATRTNCENEGWTGAVMADYTSTPSPPAVLTQVPSPTTPSVLSLSPPAPSIAADTLVTRRLRGGLLQPTIQTTWRDYLTPLESKVRELVQIAKENIEPILMELRAPRSAADGLVSAPQSQLPAKPATPAPGLWRQVTLAGGQVEGRDSVPSMGEGEWAARTALCAARETPVTRLVRLLRGDEEYLTMIHTMDDEFLDDGAAWQQRSSQMRLRGAALSDYVPVYGLVLSRLHRLEMEHRTVLELWGRGVR